MSSLAGGCDEHGWNPESGLAVRDLAAEAARPYAPRKFVFRLHRRLLENEFHDRLVRGDRQALQEIETTWLSLDRLMQEARNESRAVAMAAKLAGASGLPASWQQALRAIAECRHSKAVSALFPYDEDDSTRVSGIVFVAARGIDLSEDCAAEGDEAVTDNDDAGSFRSVPVELTEHSKHVEGRAREFARASGLAEPLARDVALAAFLHDEGKRDDRFQLYLRRGDMLQTLIDGRVLAKSGTGSATRALDALARRRSGLPDKWRHEADSVRRALDHPRFSEAHDRLLVLWLIGTHHGYGRPLYPHSDPRATGPQDLDFRIEGLDWPQIFSKLLRRYGPWELARLESVVRLADHRASEGEESNGENRHREKGRAEVYS